jgi:hypothetical protein
MNSPVEMGSSGMIINFEATSGFASEIFWYYRWEGFMKYTVEMNSRWHDLHTKVHEDWHRRSSNIKVLPQQFECL